MFALVASQFVTTPVSMVVNAMLARSLGASSFGAVYLATTTLALAFLVVEWGGGNQISAAVARDRTATARIVGTGVLLRVTISSAVLAAIPFFADWMHYDDQVRIALRLCGLRLALVSVGTLCSAVLRGHEKLHWHALASVAGNLLDAALVIPTLLLGGGLRQVLTAQVVAAALALAVQLTLVSRLGVGRFRVERRAVHLILGGGFSFFVLDIILKLQPYIDASFLERLAASQSLGWFSAANRITGVLMFPAYTLTTALYPTMARLWHGDRETCNQMVRLGLRMVMLIGMLAATGAALFSPFVVDVIYGHEKYAPAAVDMSILSAYVLLVYMSMVLGSFLSAAGRQWKYAFAQSFCLLVSAILDPMLIPWAQQRYGNGSIGVCMSLVTAEVAMVSAGILLLPRKTLNRSVGMTSLRCALAGALAGAVGLWLRPHPLLAIPATVLAYAGALRVQGELNPELLVLVPPRLLNALPFLRRHVPPAPP
jgi:O-antigen/teichoic acid export membrane protein